MLDALSSELLQEAIAESNKDTEVGIVDTEVGMVDAESEKDYDAI